MKQSRAGVYLCFGAGGVVGDNRMTSYPSVRRSAIHHLLQTARESRGEAGFLLDMKTGEQLDYQEATDESSDEITFIVDLTGASNVAVLHNHRDDTPPGADDWQNFIHQSAFQEMVVVTPIRQYDITKPAGWKMPAGETPKLTFLRFQAMLERARRAAGHVQGFRHLPESAQHTLLRETNEQMARFCGVDMGQENIP